MKSLSISNSWKGVFLWSRDNISDVLNVAFWQLPKSADWMIWKWGFVSPTAGYHSIITRAYTRCKLEMRCELGEHNCRWHQCSHSNREPSNYLSYIAYLPWFTVYVQRFKTHLAHLPLYRAHLAINPASSFLVII